MNQPLSGSRRAGNRVIVIVTYADNPGTATRRRQAGGGRTLTGVSGANGADCP